ncbi:MAG: DUF4412 domain-containing protein [Bacteroidota bacterium]
MNNLQHSKGLTTLTSRIPAWHYRHFLFCMALVFPIASHGLAQFEGIIVSKNLTTDELGVTQEFTMTMSIKKDMARIQTTADSATPTSVMIYRTDQKVVWMLSDVDSSYFEISQADPVQEIHQQSPLSDQEKYKVKRTGKKKKMLGYPAEQIILSRGDEKTVIWGTKKLVNVSKAISSAFGEEHAQIADGWNDEVVKLGFFLLKAETTIAGRIVESQDITKIEERPLEDNLFIVPRGYRKQDAGNMFDGSPAE